MTRPDVYRTISLSVVWMVAEVLSSRARPLTEHEVFPTVIAENSSAGTIALSIDRSITLTLQESSAFASKFRVFTHDQDATEGKEIQLTEFGGKVYVDQSTQAVLLISYENGVRVTGLLGGGVRIAFKENLKPRNDGRIAHNLFTVEGDYSLEAFYRDNRKVNVPKKVKVNARSEAPSREPMVATAEAVVVVSREYSASFSNSTGHKYRHLIDYLRVLFQAANLILRSTDTDILDVQLLIVGVVILTEYTEILSKNDELGLVETNTPEALLSFMASNRHPFREADVVFYMSKHHYALTYQGGHRKVKGKSLISTCDIS
ncbi:uncharacterized protein LOC119402045 [Rhipicephalus sanguineus]|uniref:uncharacterized protein LOC119402045 n=1 Tax=Rhipicephalus sanguineus TaxID=34632 RepID=UPI0020C51EDB|nr:uncharacterized protein LOC119402045 [Rhipicephalus sanguineus]